MTGGVSRLLGRAAAALAAAFVAAALAIAAAGFFVAALYLRLEAVASPAIAALICGGVLLVVAFGVLGLASALGRRGRTARPSEPPLDTATRVGQALGETARRSLEGKAPHAVLAAVAAGFALGVSPRLRRALLRLLG